MFYIVQTGCCGVEKFCCWKLYACKLKFKLVEPQKCKVAYLEILKIEATRLPEMAITAGMPTAHQFQASLMKIVGEYNTGWRNVSGVESSSRLQLLAQAMVPRML